jgi:ABC-type transport system involved in multi-copper enzyme maturation permease subunit
MLPGPVFNFEVLALSRRPRYYVFRFLYGLILLAIVWLNDPRFYRYPVGDSSRLVTIQEMSRIGYTIFGSLMWTQGLAILFLVPALVSGVIADERQRKTLQYLLASCLTSGEIVVGKLAARLLFTATFLAVGLPVFVILAFLGGVDPDFVLVFFASSASLLFFLGSMAILISTHARRPRDAISMMYILEFAWIFVPTLLTFFFPWLGGIWSLAYEWFRPVVVTVASSSPFYLLTSIPGGWNNVLSNILWMIGLQMGFGSVMLGLAILRLRPASRREGGAARITARSLRFLRRPRCLNDAMLWKECFVAKSPLSNQIATTLVFLVVGGMMVYFSYDSFKAAFRELLDQGYTTGAARLGYNETLRVILTLLYVCVAIGVASASAHSLTGERDEDTWVSLVSTPLTPFEILRAKLVGALWTMRWVVALWLAFAISGLAVGSLHPVGFFAGWTLMVVYSLFICALGMTYSLRSRTSGRALLATIFTLVVMNGMYLLLSIPFQSESVVICFGVTPMFEAISLMSYNDFNDLFGLLGGWNHNQLGETLLAGILSFLFYAVGAMLLIWHMLSSFDAVNDRPSGRNHPKTKAKPRPFDPELDPPGKVKEAKPGMAVLQEAAPEVSGG